MDVYEVSRALGEVEEVVKGVGRWHYYRYRYLVDGSELGEGCKYARVTRDLGSREEEELREWVRGLVERLGWVLRELGG
jgi:hypothetical protein